MAFHVERYLPSAYVLHKKRPVSDVCENGFIEQFYSKNDLRTGILEFVVEGNAEHLIVPSKTYLKLELQLTGTSAASVGGKTVTAGAKVGMVNNMIQSVFESVEVFVSNQATTKTDRNNGYNTFLQTICNHGEDALKTYFELSGFQKDTAGKMDSIDGTNDGFTKRRAMFKGTENKVELIGKVFSPIFFQEKALPTQTSLRIILRQASKQFMMMHEDGDFDVKITDAVLMVQKVHLVTGLKQSYIDLLEEGHAIPYFLRTPSINHITIEEGSSQYMRDNLFLGKMPRRVIIGMVETDAYHGRKDRNPYNFKDFGLSEICLYKDGNAYPRPLIKLDFAKEKCADAYHNFMTSLNAAYTRNVPHITMKEYMTGYTLFSYDLSPDQMGSTPPGGMLNMNSNIRLEMKFKQPTTKNITLLVYNEMDHLMEIHKDRQVTVDF